MRLTPPACHALHQVAIVFANKVLMDNKWGFKFVFGEWVEGGARPTARGYTDMGRAC